MFDRLAKHHVGFIVPVKDRPSLEKKHGRPFVLDAVQGTHVLFVDDPALGIKIELICQEGRAAKQPLGFAHICYDLKDRAQLKEVEDFIAENKLGYPVTQLEKSGSKECGFIRFYYLKNHGIIELNVP